MLERMTEESPTKPGARFEASFQYSPKMIKLQQQTGDQKLRSRTLRPHAAIRESREHTDFTSSPPGSDEPAFGFCFSLLLDLIFFICKRVKM